MAIPTRWKSAASGSASISCGCPDHKTNRLGTCKHIEGALRRLSRRVRSREVSRRIEVFLDERNGRSLCLSVPESLARDNPVLVAEVERLFGEVHQRSGDALAGLHAVAKESSHSFRVSHRLESWVAALRSVSERRLERARLRGRPQCGPALDGHAQAPASALPDRRGAASGLRRARAIGRRHGPSARPCRLLRPAPCCASCAGSNGCLWCRPPRSRPSGWNRLPASPTCRPPRSTAISCPGAPPTRGDRSSRSAIMSRWSRTGARCLMPWRPMS